MRLAEAKIRYLSEKLADRLDRIEGVDLLASREILAREVAGVIRTEMKLEEELDREVEKVLGRYRREISSGNLDLESLRRRVRQQLARERGIVL